MESRYSRLEEGRGSQLSIVSQQDSVFSQESEYSLCDSGTIVSEGLKLCSSLGWRLREERDLIVRQKWWILGNTVVLVYGTMFVFLNIAFYRFPVEEKRLKDLGHELLPLMSDELANSGIVDAPMDVLMFIAFLLMVSTFVNNAKVGKRNPKPHFINILLRGSSVYAIGHVLRAFTYLSTSPPGSAPHCLKGGQDFEANKPTIGEIFYTAADVYHNCGDLMFSGHLLLCLTLALTINFYGASAFWISAKSNNLLTAFAFFLCAIESCLILAARHHYSSDVVVAWYVTPLLWYYYNSVLSPRDLKPDLEGIARDLIAMNQVEEADEVEEEEDES